MGWHVRVDGRDEGAFPGAQLADRVRAGKLARGALIREEGSVAWIPIEDSAFGLMVPRGSGSNVSPEQSDSRPGAESGSLGGADNVGGTNGRVKIAAVLAAIGLLAAWVLSGDWHVEAGSARVEIECKRAQDGATCEVTQPRGSTKAEVCWVFNVACANGVHAAAEACVDLDPGQVATHLITQEDFGPTIQACDEVTGNSLGETRVRAR